MMFAGVAERSYIPKSILCHNGHKFRKKPRTSMELGKLPSDQTIVKL